MNMRSGDASDGDIVIISDASMTNEWRRARLLAFYLPQYHPIPENDAWWGRGFTEWTNVTQARALFSGHRQPRLPSELGFYDLRVPETRRAQADLARDHGIEAFCYWHYWFAGKRLLERPFSEVLASGEPDFPFCLAWANQTWSGIWHGCPGRTLIEQTYPGERDYRAHFEALLPAFEDRRYLAVDGKPFFLVFRPTQLPDPNRFTHLWRELAVRHGLNGLFLVGQHGADWDPRANGFDARIPLELPKSRRSKARPSAGGLMGRVRRWTPGRRPEDDGPELFDYSTVFQEAYARKLPDDELPLVIPRWDNTPRCGRRGYVLWNDSPAAFGSYLQQAIGQVMHRSAEHRLVMLKSWNEWAEGNYLEPDQELGRGYLEAMKAAVAQVLAAPRA
jgi:hypothetical protein